MMIQPYFADLHIHIGRDKYKKPVKITGSKNLTLTNILKEASRRKGIDLIGVIDSHAPAVQEEIIDLIQKGDAYELDEGGIRFENVTLLLGAEIEVYDEYCQGPLHTLCFFPTLEKMRSFTEWLVGKMKNITLSSQRYYGSGKALQYETKRLDGLFIPAHVFTPFKSLYGKGVHESLTEVFDPDLIDGIELGLSSDTKMADQIAELHDYTYVTNSDAHSLAKIAREYQKIWMDEPTFKEFNWALHGIKGRYIGTNYGMNPYLGKYYSTVCSQCYTVNEPHAKVCVHCGSKKVIKGVADRIRELRTEMVAPERPDYIYQVPLDYIPKLGPKTMTTLLDHFGNEMNVIHKATLTDLEKIVSKQIAQMIYDNRVGKLSIEAGGGGKYGRIHLDK